MSASLHGKAVEDKTVNIDSTVQEKYITYSTDGKLAIKIINRLNKLAKCHGIQQRRTFQKEVKSLRTIAGILIKKLERKLKPEDLTH